MSESEIVKANDLLERNGIKGNPLGIELITMIGKKPYAYRVTYRDNVGVHKTLCYEVEVIV